MDKALAAYADAQVTDNQIWATATRFSKANPSSSADRHMIPALNDMFDIATERHARLLAKVPVPILWMMVALCLCGAFFNGYSNGLKRRLDWILTAVFSIFLSFTVFIILDLDMPRRGLITSEQGELIIEANRSLLQDVVPAK